MKYLNRYNKIFQETVNIEIKDASQFLLFF